MPKQLYKITQFHGGLNSNSDARDIAENQLSEAVDVMVDKVGKITTLGGFDTHDTVDSNTATNSQGRGLFQFSHDRLGAETAGTGQAETGDDYLALTDAATTTVDIWSKSTDNWGTEEFNLGSDTSGFEPSIYAVDGALRVCDGNFANTNSVSKWFGYIQRTLFAGLNSELALNGWYTEDQEIKPGRYGVCTHEENDDTYPSTHDSSNWRGHIFPTFTNGYISMSMIAKKIDTGGWRGFKNYYYSLIYDGGQESKLFWMQSGSDMSDDVHENATKSFIVYIDPEEFTGATNPGINKRCTGAKIYWKSVDSGFVAYGDAYLLLICDWVQGVKSPNADDWIAWGDQATDPVVFSNNGNVSFTGIEFTDEPRTETYRSQTGFSEDCVSIDARYKTSVVANRMTFIGNIKAKNHNSTAVEVVMGDSMIKSPVNQFDSFPTDRTLDIVIRDGDEIIHLEEYADRILQFKKNKLYILNISQEIEFIEAELAHKGVNNPGSVAKTDLGIVWANKHGCFFYNGESVNNLLEKGGLKMISDSDWDSFLPSDKDPMVGYIPNKRQVIVADAVDAGGDGSIFLYDFVTQSWIKGSAATITDAVKSNFVTDWDGELIYHSGSTTYQWNDAPATSTAVDIKTKDIDFGQPGQVKRIYKFYVTHRGSASNIQLSYAVDGDQDTYTEAGSELPVTSAVTDWVTTAITPTTFSCNSVRLRLFSDGTTPANFEINDISIVYRVKKVV